MKPTVGGEGVEGRGRSRRYAGMSTRAAATASATRWPKTPTVSKLGANGTTPNLDHARVLGLKAAIPQ